jgi:hypothetical protein
LHLGMAAAELAFSSPNNRACLLIRHMRCWSFKADFALPAALLLRCRGFVLSAAGAAAAAAAKKPRRGGGLGVMASYFDLEASRSNRSVGKFKILGFCAARWLSEAHQG